MTKKQKIDGVALADLAETVSELREKFAGLPEDQATAEAECAVLETRDEMRAERADVKTRASVSVPSKRLRNG